MDTLTQKGTNLLRDDLDDTEALLAELRPGYVTAVSDTRQMILRLICRAVSIRRQLGLLPYTAAGLSPIVAVSLDIEGDHLVARVTHEQEHDDDVVCLGDLDDPGLAGRVPADLFDDYRSLLSTLEA